MVKFKDKIKVLKDIREISSKHTNRAEIIERTNLKQEIVVDALDILKEEGLIDYISRYVGKDYARISAKGKKFLSETYAGPLSKILFKIKKINPLITLIVAVGGLILGILHFFI